MPRKGKGQKVQTATGQEYGQAKMQEEAQETIPLPEIQQMPSMRPGEVAFNRPTERPMEPIDTPGNLGDIQSPEDLRQRKLKVLNFIPMMEQMSSQPYANPKFRNAVRQMKSFVGDMEELYQDEDQ
jgi:hypothetical protein|tara:strand:+ start:42 stop:419 length:378 start_codon:yes stop_codon:yes gene_type:complete